MKAIIIRRNVNTRTASCHSSANTCIPTCVGWQPEYQAAPAWQNNAQIQMLTTVTLGIFINRPDVNRIMRHFRQYGITEVYIDVNHGEISITGNMPFDTIMNAFNETRRLGIL